VAGGAWVGVAREDMTAVLLQYGDRPGESRF
jgi:hypothetical protein